MEHILGWIVNIALLAFLIIFIRAITPSAPRQNQRSATPAFPLHLTPILGRGREISLLKRVILTGQSGAIVGMFEQERTAILGYLMDPDHSQTLYEEYADKLIFSLVDISMLPKDCQPAQFWQRALKPLEDKRNKSQTLLESYKNCQHDQFDEYSLGKLMVQVKQEGWRLVLMLDRFDELLNNSNLSNLKQPEFFALLRGLASSRPSSPLSLIISGNLSLKQFHDQTKGLNPKGSPYFNFMESYEIVLGLLSDAKIDELLQKNGFSQADCQYIKEVAGQHPHFIRLVAEALQKAKEHQEIQPWEAVKQELLAAIVANTLVNLNTEVCQTLVALVKGKPPATTTWIELLEKQGLLRKDAGNDNWQVSPPMLLDFINSETEQELCNR